MVDPQNGRLLRYYVAVPKSGTDVVAFDVDFTSLPGWVAGHRWMLVGMGAHTGGNEEVGYLTLSIGGRALVTGLLSFGQLVYDSGGTAGAGFSRHAEVPLRTRLPDQWDGRLHVDPTIVADTSAYGSITLPGWSTAQIPVVWLEIQRLVRRDRRYQ